MKKICKLFFLVIIFSVGYHHNANAQSAGDIAFIALHGDGANSNKIGDHFAFVTLIDFPANTPIWFTDNIWDGDSFENLDDREIKWEHTEIVPAGTVIVISGITTQLATIKIDSGPGTITFDGLSFGTSIETVFALLSEPSTSTMVDPGFLAGLSIDFDGETNTLTGTGLTSGTDFIDFDNAYDGFKYTGSRSSESSYADYLPLIMNTANWQQESANGYEVLPIEAVGFTISGTTTWNGTTTAWSSASNWNNGVPTDDITANIPNTGTNPIISGDVVAGNISVETGVTLNLLTGNTLDVKGTIEVAAQGVIDAESGSTINAGAIVGQSESSIVTRDVYMRRIMQYRNIPTDADWYLIGRPTPDQRPQEFRLINGIRKSSSNSNWGISWYLNDGSAWEYINIGTSILDFESLGNAFAISLSSSQDILFDGTIESGSVDYAISEGSSNAFNLIGNPYPSYIPLNTDADDSNDILSNNSGVLSEQTIWLWDSQGNGGAGDYITLNQATGARFIAPGQGFFVSSNASGGNFTFTTAMQSAQSTDVFTRPSSTRPEITLKIDKDNESASTKVFYIAGTTKDFDNGYDSSAFSGTESDFNLYTHLVESSEEKKLSIQSLPNENIDEIIVPVEIKTEAAEITFTAETENMSDLNLFLEDRQEGVFTNLSEADSEYRVTFSDDQQGIGRFYLHLSSESVLSTDVNIFNSLSIYKSSDRQLTISGLINPKTAIRIYSLLGKEIYKSSFKASGVNIIDLPSFSPGIYIVQLETNEGSTSKKVVLE